MGWAHNTQVGFELPIYDVAPESSPVLCSCKKDLVGVLDDEPEIRVTLQLAVLGWAVLGVYAESLTDIDITGPPPSGMYGLAATPQNVGLPSSKSGVLCDILARRKSSSGAL